MLDKLVKVALDELRMQMLGTQVLFGFQLQGVFQENFNSADFATRVVDTLALSMVVIALAILVAPAAQHRIVERGNTTRRIFKVATRFAELALFPIAFVIGADVYVVAQPYWGALNAALGASAAFAVALLLWYGLGEVFRKLYGATREMNQLPEEIETDCHTQIEQMLTEARVVLPGAQALLGFQFVVTMTKAFSELAPIAQHIHFAALGAVALAAALLITPASVHRIAFGGRDIPRFHKIGSALVTVALLPLSLGISGDVYVAVVKIFGNSPFAACTAAAAFILLLALWYVSPLFLRSRRAVAGAGSITLS